MVQSFILLLYAIITTNVLEKVFIDERPLNNLAHQWHNLCIRAVLVMSFTKTDSEKSHPFLLRNFLIFSLQTPFLLYRKLQILKFSFFWSSILDKVQHFVSHRNVRKKPFPSRQKSSKFYIEFQKIHFSKLRRLHK